MGALWRAGLNSAALERLSCDALEWKEGEMRGRWSEEELERTRRAALSLRPIELEVLFLSAQDRLRNDEIATRLGVSERAVRRHLTRAIYRLAFAAEEKERPWWRLW